MCPGLVVSTLARIHCPKANGGVIRSRVITSSVHVRNGGMSFSVMLRGTGSPFTGSLIGTTRRTVLACINRSISVGKGVSVAAPCIRPGIIRSSVTGIGGVVTISSNGNNINGSAITTGLTVDLGGVNCGINLLSTSVFNPSVPGVFGIRSTHPVTARTPSNHRVVRPVRRCNVGVLSVNFFISPSDTIV